MTRDAAVEVLDIPLYLVSSEQQVSALVGWEPVNC